MRIKINLKQFKKYCRKNTGVKLLAPFLLICMLSGFSADAEKQEYKSTIDYIKKTDRLWGISEIRVNSDNSITLVDAESGYGYALMLSLTKAVKSVTLYPGESCTLSDGHHTFIMYEFRKHAQGRIVFAVTDKFDARSFGNGIKKETKLLVVSPYREEK